MSRLWIYPDDFEFTDENPLGRLEEQAKLLLIADMSARRLKLKDVTARSGYGKSSVTHMLSNRRSLTMTGAQLLAQAMDRTWDLRLITPGAARKRMAGLEGERDD